MSNEEEFQIKERGHNIGYEKEMNRGREGRRENGGRREKNDDKYILRKKDYSENFNRSINKNNDDENENGENNENNNNYHKDYCNNSYNNQNYYSQNNKKKYLSFRKIKELSKKEMKDIILFFEDKIYEEIKNTKFREDSCYLMMNILRRISESNSESTSMIFNKIIENTNFLKDVKCYIDHELFEEDKYLDFFYDTFKFLNKCLFLLSKGNIIENYSKYIDILENIKKENTDKNEIIDLNYIRKESF